MLKKRNQKGFTLIEIIAVLIILGILAAVAIPRYFDMQADARRNATQGAVAALQSTASLDYSKQLLTTPATTTYTPTAGTITVGDFTGTIASDTNGVVTVAVIAGPAWFNTTDITGTYISKTFALY